MQWYGTNRQGLQLNWASQLADLHQRVGTFREHLAQISTSKAPANTSLSSPLRPRPAYHVSFHDIPPDTETRAVDTAGIPYSQPVEFAPVPSLRPHNPESISSRCESQLGSTPWMASPLGSTHIPLDGVPESPTLYSDTHTPAEYGLAGTLPGHGMSKKSGTYGEIVQISELDYLLVAAQSTQAKVGGAPASPQTFGRSVRWGTIVNSPRSPVPEVSGERQASPDATDGARATAALRRFGTNATTPILTLPVIGGHRSRTIIKSGNKESNLVDATSRAGPEKSLNAAEAWPVTVELPRALQSTPSHSMPMHATCSRYTSPKLREAPVADAENTIAPAVAFVASAGGTAPSYPTQRRSTRSRSPQQDAEGPGFMRSRRSKSAQREEAQRGERSRSAPSRRDRSRSLPKVELSFRAVGAHPDLAPPALYPPTDGLKSTEHHFLNSSFKVPCGLPSRTELIGHQPFTCLHCGATGPVETAWRAEN